MNWLRIALLLVVALCCSAEAHEITFSQMDVRLEKEATLLTVKLPITALIHEQPMLEQTLRSSPLPTDAQAALTELLTTRLRVASGETTLRLMVGSSQQAGENVAMSLSGPPVDGALGVWANLFPDDPLHKVFVNVYREAALVGQYALDRQNPALTLAASERPLWEVITTFLRAGIHHIFIGPDHILFVLALILLGGRLWSQLKIITAFAVAHSITLALATLNVVYLPSRLVEGGIALSIVVVGLHDLRELRRSRPAPAGRDLRVMFAFGFGLIHGFGFAGVLAEFDLPKQALVWSLAAFNFGVEIGQVFIVLLAAPLLTMLRRFAPPRIAHFQMTAAACGVVVAGSFWLCLRALDA